MKTIYLLIFFPFTFTFTLHAQTVVVSASQDNTIYSDFPGNSNGAGVNFTAGSVGTPGSFRRALIRFDISSVPAGATITAATLTLNMNKTASAGVSVSLHPLAISWGEGSSDAGAGADGQGVAATTSDATWPCSFAVSGGGCVTAWSVPGADFLSAASASTVVNNVGTYSWSGPQMVADIQAWVNAPTSNFGWLIKGEEAAPRSAKRFDSRSSANTAARPSLSITYTTVAPVTLRSFNAQAHRYGSLLKWETEQEFNNDYFEIEHSTDGRLFSPVGQVKGSGNSSVPKSYQFIHQVNQPGRHFYRLAQVDINKNKHYSPIATVQVDQALNTLLIAPNPVGSVINIPGYNDVGSRFQVINVSGQAILQGTIQGNTIRLPSAMNPGVYQLTVYSADGSARTSRFQKQ